MGWLNTFLLGDIGNRLDIQATEEDIERLRRRADTKDHHIRMLEAELARHKLAITALTRYLISRQIVDAADLDAFTREIDGEDGVIDGKLTTISPPPAGRPSLPKQRKKSPPPASRPPLPRTP